MSPVEGQTTDKTIKSHKMIILALDYKFTENGTWVPIPIQQYSGSFVEQPEQTDAGILMSAEVTAYMPVEMLLVSRLRMILAACGRKLIVDRTAATAPTAVA